MNVRIAEGYRDDRLAQRSDAREKVLLFWTDEARHFPGPGAQLQLAQNEVRTFHTFERRFIFCIIAARVNLYEIKVVPTRAKKCMEIPTFLRIFSVGDDKVEDSPRIDRTEGKEFILVAENGHSLACDIEGQQFVFL